MTADQIIAAFGGIAPVSEITGARRNAVANWRHAGIPAKYWPTLERSAKAKRIKGISLDVLENHTKGNGVMQGATSDAR